MQADAYAALMAIILTVGLIAVGKAWPTLGMAIHALRLRGVGPGDVREGPVAVTGSPQPTDDTVESPWTEVDCLAYDAFVHRHQRRQNNSNWQPIRVMGEEVPFELRGPTGAVEVDPEEADLHMKETYRAVTGGKDESPPDPEHATPGRSRFSLDEFSSNGNFRYREERIDPSDRVTVFGVANAGTAGARSPTITDGDGWFDPPFVVYTNESSDPLRQIVVRTFGLLGIAVVSVAAAVWLTLSVF